MGGSGGVALCRHSLTWYFRNTTDAVAAVTAGHGLRLAGITLGFTGAARVLTWVVQHALNCRARRRRRRRRRNTRVSHAGTCITQRKSSQDKEEEEEEEEETLTLLLGDTTVAGFAVTQSLQLVLVEAAPVLAFTALPLTLVVGNTH